MWVWDLDLIQLGFRRRADRCWLCARRFGLRGEDHLSVFSWSEQTIPGRQRRRYLVELTEFHVTFHRAAEHIHFYYHEHEDQRWHRGGHTSWAELERLGLDGGTLRAEADAVAEQVITLLGGQLEFLEE